MNNVLMKLIFVLIVPPIFLMSVHAADPEDEKNWSKRTTRLTALILENVDEVSIRIYPGGALRDKGLDDIILCSAKHPFFAMPREDFPQHLLLDGKEMQTFVKALADGGVFDGVSHYNPSLKIVREPFRPKGYAIVISNLGRGYMWVMEADLGWDLNTIKILESLRKGLIGKSGKAMDQLLGKLNDQKKEWEAQEGTAKETQGEVR